MHPRLVLALFLVAVFALGALVMIAATRDEDGDPQPVGERFAGAASPPGLRAPDFSLIDQNGERITMRELRGRPAIVTFLYTTCEDTCPLQVQQVKGALDDLGEDVPALAIAVDPPRDTPDSARRFLAEQKMTGRMSFVLGTRAELRPLWKAYGVRPQREALEHNARFVLVDPRGRQRIAFPLDQITPESVAHDLRMLAAGR